MASFMFAWKSYWKRWKMSIVFECSFWKRLIWETQGDENVTDITQKHIHPNRWKVCWNCVWITTIIENLTDYVYLKKRFIQSTKCRISLSMKYRCDAMYSTCSLWPFCIRTGIAVILTKVAFEIPWAWKL